MTGWGNSREGSGFMPWSESLRGERRVQNRTSFMLLTLEKTIPMAGKQRK